MSPLQSWFNLVLDHLLPMVESSSYIVTILSRNHLRMHLYGNSEGCEPSGHWAPVNFSQLEHWGRGVWSHYQRVTEQGDPGWQESFLVPWVCISIGLWSRSVWFDVMTNDNRYSSPTGNLWGLYNDCMGHRPNWSSSWKKPAWQRDVMAWGVHTQKHTCLCSQCS